MVNLRHEKTCFCSVCIGKNLQNKMQFHLNLQKQKRNRFALNLRRDSCFRTKTTFKISLAFVKYYSHLRYREFLKTQCGFFWLEFWNLLGFTTVTKLSTQRDPFLIKICILLGFTKMICVKFALVLLGFVMAIRAKSALILLWKFIFAGKFISQTSQICAKLRFKIWVILQRDLF